MKLVISILLLFSWTLSSLSAKTEAPLVLDHSSHIQSIFKQNSESESPEHYQSFSEIDIEVERDRLVLFLFVSILPELKDTKFSNLAYYSEHFHAFNLPALISLHLPLYIKDRQFLI
jgi:hypothetical protein